MKGEIDKDFYCSAGFKLNDKGCRIFSRLDCGKDHCLKRHRKHPTREQFKEEYGDEWKGAVYIFLNGIWHSDERWKVRKNSIAVCACTPWGKPADTWRPK
jgi:hypothetical protein